ncbi:MULTISPECIES: hypothetical protein [Luteibacter]|uniref:Uncharacterized protein n=1 Tax=Luteibacter flocculans TaxID=2780091 RepID=A0ABY4SZ24_9GAMM|nr:MULTISPECIES: hypothetical protein [Luteibacter]URL57027.1 hypothetical protein IM816_10160 [Luteibacter flocculans]SFW28410.1 hypothetical protein SAMN02800691_0765 [Luteibacter sp. UNCMF366Tsu5.1]
MQKLSGLRVPPEWEAALIACLDQPPRRARSRRSLWLGIVLLAFVLAGIAGTVAWLDLRA